MSSSQNFIDLDVSVLCSVSVLYKLCIQNKISPGFPHH